MHMDTKRRGMLLGAVLATGVVVGLSPWLRRGQISRDVVSREWDELPLVPNRLSMKVPWPLRPRLDSRLPNNVSILVGEEHHAAISVTLVQGPLDVPLETAASGGVDALAKTPGLRLVSWDKRPGTILGRPGLDVTARFKRGSEDALGSGVFFKTNDHLVAAFFLHAANDESAPAVWTRLRAGFKLRES